MNRRFIISLCFVLWSGFMAAQTVVLHETFENGIPDTTWSQECVSGNTLWVTENQNLSFPATAHSGASRACLRNTTGETQGYVTRLISRVMDLTEVYHPTLVMWYANPKWMTDRDTLRVLYRTSEKAAWKLAREFSSSASDWTKAVISLPEYGKTYQIAFEGTDNLGRGIVLDDIMVRSEPECLVPKDLNISTMQGGVAQLSWLASWDANGYEVVISTDSLDPDTVHHVPGTPLYAPLATHTVIDDGFQMYTDLRLESGSWYYAYVRSLCDNENSAWSSEGDAGQYHFRLRTVYPLPFADDFNRDYTGYPSQDRDWSWENNIGAPCPFIATQLNQTACSHFSPDATPHLAFAAGVDNITPIPAGRYACVATPGLDVSGAEQHKIQDYQVRFIGTVYTSTGRTYAHRIIVGVMTTPEDFTTFVPVDTVSINEAYSFSEHIVSLSSYPGDGTYVAFASDEKELPNLFYIDDVTVELRPALNRVTKVSVLPHDTFAIVSWEGQAPAYNLVISDIDAPVDHLTEEHIIVRKEHITSTSLRVEGLQPDHGWNRPYYVTVQAVGTGITAPWSYRRPFITLTRAALPAHFDMEQTSGIYAMKGNASVFYPSGLGLMGNAEAYPSLSSAVPHSGKYALYLNKEYGKDAYITLPEVDSLAKVQLSFYLSGHNAYTQTRVEVGVMTNPMDINTFEPIAEYTCATASYKRCYADFTTYHGNGHFIAIVWRDMGPDISTVAHIDDIAIEELSSCVPPTGITVQASPYAATLSWPTGTTTRWEVAVSANHYVESELYGNDGLLQFVMRDTVSAGSSDSVHVAVNGLDFAKTYYYYIRALCAGNGASWWAEGAFATPCPEQSILPWRDDFERYEAGNTDFGCWTAINMGYQQGTYPRILNGQSSAYSGKQAIDLYTSRTHSSMSMVVVPQAATPLCYTKLTFHARSYKLASESFLIVGTMAAPDDTASFTPLDTVYLHINEGYKLFQYNLSGYRGTNTLIAFSSGTDIDTESNDVLIDDVEMIDIRCAAPYNIHAQDVTRTSFTLAWEGISTNKWEVEVAHGDTIKLHRIIPESQHSIAVTGLQTYTAYRVRVRPLCGDSTWGETEIYSGCFTLDPKKMQVETFENYKGGTSFAASDTHPTCWTTGNALATGNNYQPYIYKTTRYSHSGTNAQIVVAGGRTAGPAWLASPEVETDDMTTVLVSFWWYASTNYSMVFGVMNNPEDIGTFTPLDSVRGYGSVIHAVYSMADYIGKIGNARYFAWRTADVSGAGSFYLDDIAIIVSACETLHPAVSGITFNSAEIRSGVRHDNDWQLLITTEPVPEDSLESATYRVPQHIIVSDSLVKNAKSCVVSDLKEDAAYYVAMRSVCSDTEKGLWTTTSFRTVCRPQTLEALGTVNFSTDEGYTAGSDLSVKRLPCWTTGSKALHAQPANIPYVNASASYCHNGHSSLFFSTTKDFDGAYAVMPAIDIDSIYRYQVSFYARGSSAASVGKRLIVGIVTDPGDPSTFVAIDTIVTTDSFHGFTVPFNEYAGDAMGNWGKNIMFLAQFDQTNTVCLTEIKIETIPACRPAWDIRADSIGEYAATLSWVGNADSYRVLFCDKVLTEEQQMTYKQYLRDTVVYHSDKVLFDHLEANTPYIVYVHALCAADGEKTSNESLSFRTNCPVTKGYEAPYFIDFDHTAQTGSGKNADCWSGVFINNDIMAGEQTYPYVSVTDVGLKGSHSLALYSDRTGTNRQETYAVAPKIAGDLNGYQVSFYACSAGTSGSYNPVLSVGYVTAFDTTDIVSTYVEVAQVRVTTLNMEHFMVDLTTLNQPIPDGARIALRASWRNGDLPSYIYCKVNIDNFRIGLPPACFAPITLSKTLIGSTEASLHWTPSNVKDRHWQIAYLTVEQAGKLKDVIASLEDAATIVEATDTTVKLTGLQPSTPYYVYARTVCTDGEISDWTTAPLAFTTKSYFGDAFFYGFEKTEEWTRAKYSSSDTYYYPASVEVGYHGPVTGPEDTRSLPYCTENDDKYSYTRSGNGYLRMGNTKQEYGGYIMFPALENVRGSRTFVFHGRTGYRMKDANILRYVQSDATMEIGLVDKGRGIESYQPMGVFEFPEPSSTTRCEAANNWLFSEIHVTLDSLTAATKQIVMRNIMIASGATTSIFVDDVSMTDSEDFDTPLIKAVTPTSSTTALVEMGNKVGNWDINVFEAETGNLRVHATIKDGAVSREITHLSPETRYRVEVSALDAPKGTAVLYTTPAYFTTPCDPVNPNEEGQFVWDFNQRKNWHTTNLTLGDLRDTCYAIPNGWTNGNTSRAHDGYANWFIINRAFSDPKWYDNRNQMRGEMSPIASTSQSPQIGAPTSFYEMGRNLSACLKICSFSNKMTPYIAMPELNCRLDTMMLEFWGRCIYNYTDDYAPYSAKSANRIVSTTYLDDTKYTRKMVIGTLDVVDDWSTLQVIDTVEYLYTTDDLNTTMKVNEDPAGNRYWSRFQVPLKNAKGKYLVFFQPGPGLFFIDDVAVRAAADNVFAPVNPRVIAVDTTSVTVTWRSIHTSGDDHSFSVVTLFAEDGRRVLRTDTAYNDTLVYTGLNPGTTYRWNVLQATRYRQSDPTKQTAFKTECLDITPDFTSGFELADGWVLRKDVYDETYKQTNCWTYGNAGKVQTWSTNQTYQFPYNYASTATTAYAHGGDYAVRLYASGSDYQTYVTLPAIRSTDAYDTIQVNFWMLPAYYDRSTGKIIKQFTSTGTTVAGKLYYARSVVVGTMTDPTNPKTFVPVDTVTYKGYVAEGQNANVGNDYLYQRFSVPLAGAKGEYIALMASTRIKGETRSSTTNQIWIDDVSLSPVPACNAPALLEVSDIDIDAATLRWTACEQTTALVIQASTDPYFALDNAFVFNDTLPIYEPWEIYELPITGLKPHTEYFWRVQSLCDSTYGEFSPNGSFFTMRAPFCIEDFRDETLGEGWKFAYNPINEVLDKQSVNLRITEDRINGWHRIDHSMGLTGAHYAAPFSSATNVKDTLNDCFWMISPIISLRDADSAHLTLDMALTRCAGATYITGDPVSEMDMADDFQFTIAVSEDAGQTWLRSNTVTWCNTQPTGQQLRDIPDSASTYRLDLSRYAGKNICLGFYRQARTYMSTGCAIHIGNIRVANYAERSLETTMCQYQDASAFGFTLNGDTVSPGRHHFSRMALAAPSRAMSGIRDTIYQLTVDYLPVPQTVFRDTICEGQQTTLGGFTTVKPRSGVYHRKLQGAICDSLVTLHLRVVPTQRVEQTLTLCPGEVYTWNKRTYNRPGIYRDTTVSSQGCDSINSLILSYYGLEDTIYVTREITPNMLPYSYSDAMHPYIEGQKPISYPVNTVPGVYRDTVSVEGVHCTAVLVHTLTVHAITALENPDSDNESSRGTIYKIIRDGHLYIIREDECYDATGYLSAAPVAL